MNTELQMLGWSVVLGLVQVLLAAATGSVGQRGLGWSLSARDETPRALTGIAGRLDRANRNFLETFAFFAAAVLACSILQRHTAGTVLGAQLYFWARLAYLPLYALGIPYLRSLAWAVSVVGIAMLLGVILQG